MVSINAQTILIAFKLPLSVMSCGRLETADEGSPGDFSLLAEISHRQSMFWYTCSAMRENPHSQKKIMRSSVFMCCSASQLENLKIQKRKKRFCGEKFMDVSK